MCKRNSPDKNNKKLKIKKKHGMCKRNPPHKYEASTGCVRETPQIKTEKRKKEKKKWDV